MLYQYNKEGDYLVPTVTSVTGADPAAGSEWSITVPTGERWNLLAVTVQCVQGATQTPQHRLIIDDGTNILLEIGAGGGIDQTISSTAQVTWAEGIAAAAHTATAGDEVFTGPLPDGLVLEAGFRLRSSTDGIGANTNFGVPRATVQKIPA